MQKKINPYLALTLILVIAYLPMLSFVMGIKNDALVVTYPIFYFFSSELGHGHIPWWHYNLHMGFPLHADPGTPFWNPIFWVFALLGKNIFVFTLLIWTHVFIATLGFFNLGKWFCFSNKLNIALSISYACSGFFVCHIQHTNNLFEAAFLPFVILYFLKLISRPNYLNAFLLSISLFFFVNSGYPGFPIVTLYFLGFLLMFILIKNPSQTEKWDLKKIVAYLLLSIVLAILFCLPYLISLIDIGDNFFRANVFSIDKTFTKNGGITIRSLISLLFPLATAIHPEFYQTDISWNNLYFGIVLLPFFFYSILCVKNRFLFPLLFSGLFLLLLSFQGSVKAICFNYLPLLNLVRSNGEFRIYFILTAIMVSGFGIEDAFRKENHSLLKKIIVVFIGILILSLAWSVLNEIQLAKNLNKSAENGIYYLMKNINIPTAIALQSITGIVFLLFFLVFIRNRKWLLLLITIDIIFSFWMNLPYTGLGRDNAFFINKSLQQSIQQINKTPDSATIQEVSNPLYKTKFLVHPALYANKAGVLTETAYPSSFSSYIQLLRSDSIIQIEKKASIASYLNNDSIIKKITPVKLNSHQIIFSVNLSKNENILIAQNYHPNWHCTVDDKEITIDKAFKTLMRISVNSGAHILRLTYYPKKEIIAWYISLIAWLVTVFLYFRNRIKKSV